MVSRLEWCLPSVVPSDFLEPILHALPFVQPQHLLNMCRHVHSYIALAATGELHNSAHKVLYTPPTPPTQHNMLFVQKLSCNVNTITSENSFSKSSPKLRSCFVSVSGWGVWGGDRQPSLCNPALSAVKGPCPTIQALLILPEATVHRAAVLRSRGSRGHGVSSDWEQCVPFRQVSVAAWSSALMPGASRT